VGPCVAPLLFLALIHRSAWKGNSPKVISKILYSPVPIPRNAPPPGTLHSPVPIPLVTPMDRYARSWMFFLQPNVWTSERTPYAPSLMLQAAGRGYAERLNTRICELLRTPSIRRSQNSPSGTFVNKDKKDRKRRGIVAQTPTSSKRHQALASASSRSPRPAATLCLSSNPSPYRKVTSCPIGALATQPLGTNGCC
jgi:hypothetical protein